MHVDTYDRWLDCLFFYYMQYLHLGMSKVINSSPCNYLYTSLRLSGTLILVLQVVLIYGAIINWVLDSMYS